MPFRRGAFLCWSIWLPVIAVACGSYCAGATPDQLRLFETKVRPLLATRCYKCHSEKMQKGDLRLDSLSRLLRGGESGPALVPGKPAESLLVAAVRYESLEMPPDGKLADEEVAVLTTWVAMGAPWPGDDGSEVASTRDMSTKITDEDRAFWSFQPLRIISPPEVEGDWARNEVDRFVQRKLAAAGITPAAEAERGTLLRRLYFDLVGLPPTPEEITQFLNDDTPTAYEDLVDRLLDSPRYGERWARHWLDLVRYAESDGYKQDAYRPNAWRYRDYVVKAFNEDKPYDRFVLEQLAGDEVAPSDLDALAATGYLRHWIYEYNQRDARTQWTTILNDITDVTGDVFLGLGMGCARCHDHKFDPIPQKDYYRLQAFFTPVLPREDIPFATGDELVNYKKQLAVWEAKTASIRAELNEMARPLRERSANSAIDKFPKDIRPMMRKDAAKRSPFERQLTEFVARQIQAEYDRLNVEGKLKGEQQARWKELKKQLASFDDLRPKPLPTALTVTDVGPVAPATFIPGKRNASDIAPGFLSVLDPSDAAIEPPVANSQSTGRRTALAKWITSPRNPLTTRVIVNRVWQHHFGQGIVNTANNFGSLGGNPTHPELLDWLAVWFADNGWSFKKLHRLIVTSATYRQSALVDASEVAKLKDPDNKLLWRMFVRRLAAEQIRDAALAASGELDLSPGGPSGDSDQPRRTIYTKVVRNAQDPVLAKFDAPDGFRSTSERTVTTTPTQSLLMINGDWMLKRARAFAKSLAEKDAATKDELINKAFERVYGRLASSDERAAAVKFMAAQREQVSASREAVASKSIHFPDRKGGLAIGTASKLAPWLATSKEGLPTADFTVEAYILLNSLYEDAAVRTIVSHWDSNNAHPGWALGVTSAKSSYQPRNLILQLVGNTSGGQIKYEVIASNLRPELNKPYYAAVSVKLAETGKPGIKFYLKDLSKPDAPLQTAQVAHSVVTAIRSERKLAVGGRDSSAQHQWDGLIDDVRISTAALSVDKLSLNDASDGKSVAAHWKFEGDDLGQDTSDSVNHLTRAGESATRLSPEQSALVDFCHVLLNSNEFLYVD